VIELDRRQRVTLIWAGLAVVLAGFQGSILILALPAIARDFHSNIPAVSGLGSILAIGTLAHFPWRRWRTVMAGAGSSRAAWADSHS
jgi:hypothetical protein